jgi:Uma2 family endonuclease
LTLFDIFSTCPLDMAPFRKDSSRMSAVPPIALPEEPDLSSIVTEDDTPVDNIASEKQQRLLTEPLYSSWAGPPPSEGGQARPFLVAANVGLFPSVHEPPLVPDVFLSLDVKVQADFWKKENRSYFFWKFGKPPELVIEVVSNREGEEIGHKLHRYAHMRIAHYVVFDPSHQLGGATLRSFELRGQRYVAAEPWFEEIGLGLVEWDGEFEGWRQRWLRFSTREGVVPTGAERALAERAHAQQAEVRAGQAEVRAGQAEVRAEKAEVRAARLAERLRALGIDPNGDG